MISLNEVELSDDLLWLNRYDEPSAILSLRRAISGNPILQPASISLGKTITLGSVSVASGYSGWFTKLQIEAFKVLENTSTVINFVYESQQFQVMIVPGSINMEPLIPRPNSEDTDNFIGSISLITV